ncbi:MAG: (2Fe-2S)-binding protein, partial [Alphaproteobacteria bacterium]|nr:(2Fe-2S)-binding protein [Alphaproteobacteria bacterium]
MSGFRLPAGGRIDRARVLPFDFDGRRYQGFAGDTLASALLAGGVTLVGRSFKYHRPRGIVTAGPEEPNALVELRAGARREPNTPATTVELYAGLEAASQNRWPSLDVDVLALNGMFARFLPAGFYYKTFMWPASFWERVYEPAIRRAAGLGRAADGDDPDRYDHVHDHCDVLVVGSGAAGLAAARVAVAAGARVILAEQDSEPGGGLLVEPRLETYRRAAVAALDGRAQLLTRTAVVGAYDHGVFAAVERVADGVAVPAAHQPRQRLHVIRARAAIFATGATDRLIAFPDNDRPGVMLANAARAYLARWGVAVGRRVALFANNDEAYAAASDLAAAGVEIAVIVDPRAESEAGAAARDAGLDVRFGHEVAGVSGGRGGLTAIKIRRRGDSAVAAVSADSLLVSGGQTPLVALASQARAKLRWDATIAAFVPGAETDRIRSAGAARGVFGLREAAADGAAAARGVMAALGLACDVVPPPPDVKPDARSAPAPLWEVRAPGKAFVDLQHDVTADDVRLAHREGYGHVEHAKRYTTLGMATDQGRIGGLVGAAVLAEARGQEVADVGLPTFRPYAVPVAWGALAGADVGAHFKPERLLPLHDWHKRNGA